MSAFSEKSTMATGKPVMKMGPKVASEIYRFDYKVHDLPLKSFKVMKDWCVISPVIPEEKTTGGIILSASSLEVNEYCAQIGRIEAVGDLFYQLEPWTQTSNPPKVGDFVFIQPYVSQRFMLGDKLFLLSPQTAIQAVFDPEEAKELGLDPKVFT